LQTFRLYRAGIEEYKQSLKAQYAELMESCVRDAVFLSSRNQELAAENLALQEGASSPSRFVTTLTCAEITKLRAQSS
jgi:hypothetical protein